MAYYVTPGLGAVFTVALVVATPVVFYWAVRLYPHTSVGRKVLLKNPQPQQVEAFREEATEMESLVGKRGVATTLLRPAGNVEIDGKWVEAQSESEMIDAGTPVEVIRISGLKVIVKPAAA
jgi:membrane-bound serine protease (ClpP class)